MKIKAAFNVEGPCSIWMSNFPLGLEPRSVWVVFGLNRGRFQQKWTRLKATMEIDIQIKLGRSRPRGRFDIQIEWGLVKAVCGPGNSNFFLNIKTCDISDDLMWFRRTPWDFKRTLWDFKRTPWDFKQTLWDFKPTREIWSWIPWFTNLNSTVYKSENYRRSI